MRSLILVFVLLFLNAAWSSVSRAQEVDYLNIELVLKKENFAREGRVPILATEPREGPDYLKDVYFVLAGRTGCVDCALSSEYSILAHAKKKGLNKVGVWLDLEFRNKKSCNIKKRFIQVRRDEPLSVELKCGIELNISFPPRPTI